MKLKVGKLLIFLYALVGYTASLITLTFLILWLYPFAFVKFNIDTPIIALHASPLFVDIGLLLLFALQHSVMARSFFKEGILKHISKAGVAATYSFASSLCLVVIFAFWQPIEGNLWNIQNELLYWLITMVFVLAWSIAFASTFMIDHFALFGLHQGYRVLRNIPEPEEKFQVNLFYKYVRHPIQAGTMVGLFVTPQMSYTHLLFSVGMGTYILIGLHLEEKSLIKLFGDTYKEYIKTTPMLIPGWR